MKTTIDLPETLIAHAKALAEYRGWTVRTVFEESLRAFIERAGDTRGMKPFRLAHTIVRGKEYPKMTFSEMLAATDLSRTGK